MSANVFFVEKGMMFACAVFLAFTLFTPHMASAAAVTLLNATSSSSNASTTLAKIGDTVSFGLRLSGTPAATSSPVIWFPNSVVGFSMASSTMSGSGAWWGFSTTSASIWADGVITFQLGWGGTAGEATTTAIFTQAASTTFLFVRSDQTAPTVTAGNISVSGASGAGGEFIVGDTVTATWDNTGSGDNNTDVYDGSVSVDFSEFGGDSVDATDASNTWTAEYTIVSGAIESTGLNIFVTATDNAGNASSAVEGTDDEEVDNDAPSTPTASPSAGTYTTAQNVTLSSSGSDSVRYTIDGTTPTCSTGTVYSSAISITSGSSVTLKAIGCDTPGNASSVLSATYAFHSVGGGGGSAAAPSVPMAPVQTTTAPSPTVVTLMAQLRALVARYVALGGTPTPEMSAFAGEVSSFARDLGFGSTGDDVRALQVFLNTHGFPVSQSGPGASGNETTVFGLATKAALMKFQEANGIKPAAGYFGPITREAINSR